VKGWLLDTNVIAEVSGNRPDPKVEKWLRTQPEQLLFLSVLTIAEYERGIEKLAPGDKRRPHLKKSIHALQARFSGRVLSLADTTVIRWGAISGEVKRTTGNWPSVIDTMLAATALEHNLYLATRNVMDMAGSGAAVFNPWKDDPINFPL
jgi:predicted nucleic acid-binding protein